MVHNQIPRRRSCKRSVDDTLPRTVPLCYDIHDEERWELVLHSSPTRHVDDRRRCNGRIGSSAENMEGDTSSAEGIACPCDDAVGKPFTRRNRGKIYHSRGTMAGKGFQPDRGPGAINNS